MRPAATIGGRTYVRRRGERPPAGTRLAMVPWHVWTRGATTAAPCTSSSTRHALPSLSGCSPKPRPPGLSGRLTMPILRRRPVRTCRSRGYGGGQRCPCRWPRRASRSRGTRAAADWAVGRRRAPAAGRRRAPARRRAARPPVRGVCAAHVGAGAGGGRGRAAARRAGRCRSVPLGRGSRSGRRRHARRGAASRRWHDRAARRRQRGGQAPQHQAAARSASPAVLRTAASPRRRHAARGRRTRRCHDTAPARRRRAPRAGPHHGARHARTARSGRR